MNKKICSILLSLAMTVSVLSTFYGTAAADTVDNQEPGTVETTAPETEPQAEQQPEPESQPETQPEPEKQPESQQETDPQQETETLKGGGQPARNGTAGQPGNESGEFGNGLSWQFTMATGDLCISGAGAIPDYEAVLSQRPWNHLTDNITSITIEDGITAVGSYAFSGCGSASTLNLGYDLQTIGKRAFENCGFTSLSLPDSLTSIGEGAFYGCDKLSDFLVIPYTVTTIGDAAFGYCGFSYAYLSDYLTSIGENLFVNCTKLRECSISYGVTKIGDGAFSGCSALTDIYIPASVTTIERCAFMNSGITNITIPDKVTTIEEQTFYGCNDLRSVTIPNSVTTIEESAFYNCLNLETITIPGSVTSISAGAFYNCAGLSSVYCQADPDNLTWGASASDFKANKGTKCYVANRYISKYETKFSNINLDFEAKLYGSGTCGANITWTLDGDGTMLISGTGAMTNYEYDSQVPWSDNRSKVITVTIEDGVTTVGNWAFYDCEYLTSVTLPDSITSIGLRAFGETDRLKSIELPANLQTIGDFAFCVSMIESIDIPDSVTSIGSGAFLSAYNMKSVTIGNNVETIGDEAFASTKIESVVIPSSVTVIRDSVFESCSALTTVTLSYGLTTIGEEAFLCCGNLKNITIPDSVTTIMSNAFNSCDVLESITIPGSVQAIGAGVFRDCYALTSVTICDGVTYIPEGAFWNCSNLKTVTLPDTITSIGENAFRIESYNGPSLLESITIPNSVTSIGTCAFYGQNLRSITIPGSVSVIVEDTFMFCENLETVTILNGVTAINDYAFRYCNNIKTVSIPASVLTIGDSQPFGNGDNLKDIYSYSEPESWVTFSYGSSYSASTKLHVPEDMVDSYRSSLNPESTLISASNLIGDAQGEAAINTGAGVHLYGYNLSLAGDVGVNFWFKIDETCLADDNYIKFTVNDKEETITVSEAANASGGFKVFRCGIVAKEMTDVITAQFYLANGTEVGSAYTYTVREYADYILAHDDYSQYAKTLVKAMLNYGACSQKYFEYQTNSLANSVLPEDERYPGIASPNGIVFTTEGPGYMKPAQVSLLLKSTVTLRLYFNASEATGKVFKCGDEVLPAVKSGQYVVVTVEGISALQLCSDVSIDVYENNTKLGTVKYCPAKYCKMVVGHDNDEVFTDDLKRVVSSLYYFSKAAENYRDHS